MDQMLLTILRENGPWVAIVAVLLWAQWRYLRRMEDALAQRDAKWEALASQLLAVISDNTEALRRASRATEHCHEKNGKPDEDTDRIAADPIRHFSAPSGLRTAARAVGLLLALLITGCVDQPAPRGSAQDQAAGATARATTTTDAADAATVDAARRIAKAEALEAAALADKTPEAIATAVAARVDAAQAAAAASALRTVAIAAQDAAAKAAQAAATERAREAAEATAQERQALAWWIAAGTTALAVAATGLLLALSAPARWLVVPACAVAGAWALYAWAAWATWIAAGVAGLLVVGLVVAAVWALRHLSRVEWPDAVDRLRAALPDAADAHDLASVARQSRPVRAVTDWLLRGQVATPSEERTP